MAYDASKSREQRIAESLAVAYGTPARDPLPLGNHPDPLDELIYILLTVQTEFGVDSVFAALKKRFSTWDHLLRARRQTLVNLLQPIGLYEQRADRLRLVLQRIKTDFSACNLDALRDMPDAEAEAYLLSLPGVGKKVARCVLMYSLGRDVLPVDAHVYRVSRRIGLLEASTTFDRAHDAIHAVVPPEYRYALHVNLVRHGRQLCRARNPECKGCPLLAACPGPDLPGAGSI